ncbi:MAG TPA: PAS domain S-box protein [Anaerolineales bacterium]|nr:PAS domain S-box protein [Anaerolineales bacterium]
MKTDRKIQVDKKAPAPKAAKDSRAASKRTSSNGKRPSAPYEHAPIGIVEASLEGKYINVNEEFCRMTGYGKQELLEYSIKDFTHEDDYAIDLTLHEKLVAGKIPFYRLEKRYLRKEGGDIWVELTRSLVRDAKGKPLYTVGVVLDISDRKDVERVLRESVERLRLATESARMYMWEWDFQKQLYKMNDNFEKVIGFSAGLLPQNQAEAVFKLSPPEDMQAISEAVQNAINNRSDLHSLQYRMTDPDSGQMVWLEANGKIVYDEDGNAVRMFGVAQNITENKKAEESLQLARRQAEQSADRTARLQKVTAALSDALTPPQVAKVLATQGAPGFGAVSSSMMLLTEDGQSLELMYSTTEESLIRPYRRFSISLHVPAADAVRSGEIVWLESRQQYLERYPHMAEQIELWGRQAAIAAPMVYEDHTLGVLALSFDKVLPYNMEDREYILTLARQGAQALERARAEDALRESEERFRALVSQATAGITQSDLESGLVFANPRFCEMLGYSEEELLGKKIWDLTYAEDLKENKRLFQRMVEEGASYQFEKRFIRKDGSHLWTNVTVSTIRGLNGKPKGGVGVIIDIEERKQAEAALTQFAREQEALYQFVDQLHRTAPFEDIFNAALDAILNALQCDRASILLYDHTKVMRFVAWRGLSDEYRKATDGHSPWSPDTIDPEPISMNDIETAELSDSLREVIRGEGICSLAFIPLVSNGKLIGKFMVYFDEVHRFDEGEIDLSLTIARQLASGIERKRAEEALRIENERFMRFVNSNIVGILIGNARGDVILANDYYLELLGVSRQEFTEGRVDWKQFTPPEWLPADESAIQQLREHGVSEIYEKEYVRADGTRVPVYIADAMLPGPGEEIAAFVVDMTERKQAEAALQESEERYRGIVNQTIAGIAETDLTGTFTTVNDRYCEMTGYTREELLNGMRMQSITHPDDLPKNEELFGRLVSHGTSFEIEKRYVRPDGSLAWVHNSVSAITSADGKPQGAVAVAIDVAERKRAEEALRRNEELFSTLIQTAPFGVYFVDSEFRLRAVNKGSEAVFNDIYPLIGRDFAEILRIVWKEPFATEAIERFRHTLRTGESFISPPTIEPRANIEEIQSYDWQIHRITMPDGTFGVVCYFYDLSEQKRMEATVRASEALYRAMAGSIPGGGIYVVDKDFRYLVAEGPVTEAFGLSREMLEGHTVMEAFPDERGKRMEERLRRNFAGETLSFETKFNGRTYWTRQAPLLDSIGHAIIVTMDITERKLAEEALHESEERFRAILRQATAGIVRKDAEGRFIFVNQAFCNMLGYTESELLGRTIWEFMHEGDIEENKRSYDRMFMEGIPFKLERRLIREDGSVIWVDASVSPIMDAEGSPHSAVAVEVDITGRKQAEEALQQLNLQLEERVLSRTAKLRNVNQTLREEIAERKKVEDALRKSEALAHENETKLRTLFELLPVGISFLNNEGQILQMNSALLDILKISKGESLNQAYQKRKYIRVDGTPMPPSEFASARAIAENRTVYNVETGIVLEDGGVVWTSVSAAPVNVADVSVVVVTVDITDNKRAEQALQESHARLRILSQRLVEVQEEERRALARELHDRVGQTLAALNINLIIINSQLSTDAAEQIGTRLNDSMKLVAETISLVRDVMTDLRPAVLDDYGLEAAIEAHLSQFISRYDINVKFEKPSQILPRLGASIEMTFLRIAQEALMNIARHAQATQVNLSLREAADEICMTIQDNGIGIQSWQEANRPGSHGLTIMRERAEAFGGNLRVRSLPGQGTKIEVSIPLRGQKEGRQEKFS